MTLVDGQPRKRSLFGGLQNSCFFCFLSCALDPPYEVALTFWHIEVHIYTFGLTAHQLLRCVFKGAQVGEKSSFGVVFCDVVSVFLLSSKDFQFDSLDILVDFSTYFVCLERLYESPAETRLTVYRRRPRVV